MVRFDEHGPRKKVKKKPRKRESVAQGGYDPVKKEEKKEVKQPPPVPEDWKSVV